MADYKAFDSSITVTRPANQTPYGNGDIVGGALEFTNIGPAGSNIIIRTSVLSPYLSAIPSGMTTFTLYLYSATPPSAVADNGVFDIPSGDRDSYLGALALGTPADIGSTLTITTNGHNFQCKLADGSTSLFGYLVTAAGFTPAANSEVYAISLRAVVAA